MPDAALPKIPADPRVEKLNEFRESNRALHAQVESMKAELDEAKALTTTLQAQVAAFTAVPPEDVSALRAKLAEQEVALAELPTVRDALQKAQAEIGNTKFNHQVHTAFLAAGGRPEASAFLLSKAREVGLTIADDGIVSPDGLTLEAFLRASQTDLAFAFQPSRGGSAQAGRGPAAPVPTIDKHDPLAVGRAAAEIASGRARVE